MLIKYEFRRAFGRAFVIAFVLGVLSGIGGIIAYYSDTQWNEPAAISCYDAWLYCLSVSEGSFYKAMFPILICLPYLPTFYSDRKSPFIFSITTRTSYLRYLRIKIEVGLISAISVILLILVFWLCVCFALFPHNLPITEFNYLPKGAFSQYFVLQPMRYITIIILLNLITGALFYLISMAISFVAKNKRLVIALPFIVYLFLILISQMKSFSMLYPVVLIAPFEASSYTIHQIVFRWIIIMIISCASLYHFYRIDNKEIL